MNPFIAYIVVTKNLTHVHRKGSSGIYLKEKSARAFAGKLNQQPSHYVPYETMEVMIVLHMEYKALVSERL